MANSRLLLEDGTSILLLESGSKVLLEDDTGGGATPVLDERSFPRGVLRGVLRGVAG